jgi:hypothetical protein
VADVDDARVAGELTAREIRRWKKSSEILETPYIHIYTRELCVALQLVKRLLPKGVRPSACQEEGSEEAGEAEGGKEEDFRSEEAGSSQEGCEEDSEEDDCGEEARKASQEGSQEEEVSTEQIRRGPIGPLLLFG